MASKVVVTLSHRALRCDTATNLFRPEKSPSCRPKSLSSLGCRMNGLLAACTTWWRYRRALGRFQT
jgi:hypothetical protein